MNTINNYLNNPRLVAIGVLKRIGKLLPDKLFLQIRYYLELGKKLNLKSPVTFNEKLNWLKLYDRKPEYTSIVDKYSVKSFVSKVIGEQFTIPTLGVWNNANDIDFDMLPNQFVLKTTHAGGSLGVVICRDKKNFDKDKAIAKLSASLKASPYDGYREWPYKNIQRRIIAEQLITDKNSEELNDYKFFCFNGEPKFCKVDFDRFVNHRANYFDLDWNLLNFGEKSCPPQFDKIIDVPQNLHTMVEIARQLSNNIPFVRVDLYNIDGKIYFGEMTLYPAGGMGAFVPESEDEKIGALLSL